MSPDSKTLHTLLHTIVDYAGLFPPAGLGMQEAAASYAEYRRSARAWMLGRFVVPVARLSELARAMDVLGEGGDGRHWRLSALVGDDIAGEMAAIERFNAAGHGAVIDAVEAKAAFADAVPRIADAVPRGIRAYVEIPADGDPRPVIETAAALRLRAKIRMGGVTAGAFPDAAAVAHFIRSCYAAGIAFKATAGLHHPVRSTRPLSYEADAPRGVMHGFLNVFLTAVFLYNGLTIRDAGELMTREALDDVEFADDHLAWKNYRLSRDEVATIRRRFAISFGSCSFREPIDDLIQTGLLT